MTRRCSVIYCKSNYDSQTEGYVSVFSLPKDKLLRKIWIRNTRTDFSKIKCPNVCVKHFLGEDVIWEDKCIVKGEVKYFRRKVPKLKEGAVPKIFYVPSSCKEDLLNLQKIGESQSEESVDETKSHQNVTTENPIGERLTNFEQQSAELKNTYIDSDESYIIDQTKENESSKLMISNFSNENMDMDRSESPDAVQKSRTESMESLEDSLDENNSEMPSYWTNNFSRAQENQDMEGKKNDVEDDELVGELIQTNSQVIKYLEKSNDIKFNMLQAMKLSNKLKLAKLKIKCRIYDLDLDTINNDK